MSPSLLSSRILARAERASLLIEPAQLELLERYYLLLERWNEKINLTALPLAGYADATLDRLIVEPMLAAPHVFPAAGSPAVWIDFGSGGGSPAVPLKIARPEFALTMVEARERKVAFLREVAGNLGLSATAVLTGRIEDLAGTEMLGMAGVVTARAVKIDDSLLGAAADVLQPRGRLALFRSAKPPVFNDFRFVSIAEAQLNPLQASVTILEKRA